MTHKNVALVLGGGGAAGNAWLIGLMAGLAESGIDLTRTADPVLGTSAGATTAAQVPSGTPIADLMASVRSAAVPAGRPKRPPPALPMAAVFERIRAISAAADPAADLQRAMGAFGLESDAELGPAAAMGTNQMDLATRAPAARAGFAQGRHEASRPTFL